MFQTLVTIATLLATSAHALLGCCWHHGHAHCQSAETANHKAAPPETCTCQHACKAEENSLSGDVTLLENAPCGDSEEHESGECEGRCQFLTNAKVELPVLDSPNLSAGMASLLASAVPQVLHCGEIQTQTRPAALLSGSLCVRDLTQIARI